MTRTELLEHYLKPTDITVKELISRDAFTQIMQFAEAHHLEQLRIGGVSKCADEVIKYIENDAEIAMPVNELMHEDGSHLTKKEYGHVLLKYLIQELRERFC